MPENTIKQQQPKQQEYEEFCRTLYPGSDLAVIMNHEKVYKFMYYQAFREQKPRGGNSRRNRGTEGPKPQFDFEAYKAVMGVTDAAIAIAHTEMSTWSKS